MINDMILFNKFTKQFTNTDMTDIRRVGRNFYLAEQRLWNIKNGVNRDIYAIGMFMRRWDSVRVLH
jgi:hypothetical protein